jgi:sulfatase modifying factor 1
LKFFEDYKKYEANVIRHNPGIDIALLAVKKPDYFSWEENCLGDIQIDAPVGFVGKNGEWYFPKGPALGIVNDLDIPLNLIKVDINSISQGSSGAPLISEGGIVGMVLRTDGITAEAVDLNGLQRALSEYNYFFSLSGASGTPSTPANNTRSRTEPSNPDRPPPTATATPTPPRS